MQLVRVVKVSPIEKYNIQYRSLKWGFIPVWKTQPDGILKGNTNYYNLENAEKAAERLLDIVRLDIAERLFINKVIKAYK